MRVNHVTRDRRSHDLKISGTRPSRPGFLLVALAGAAGSLAAAYGLAGWPGVGWGCMGLSVLAGVSWRQTP